jgi:hypothetical protein
VHLLVVAALGVLVLVVVVLLPPVMVMAIFGFRKKPAMGSDARHMLLPLNRKRLLREAPRK